MGWIPLKWELPRTVSDYPFEMDGEWAIFTDGRNVSVERAKKDGQDHFFPQGAWFDFDDVTHWMPLPKLPDMPQTNADRIRGMTDEELEEMLYSVEICRIMPKSWSEWLKSPAEKDGET